MSSLLIRPSKLEGEVRAPPSKSYTHRAVSLALLAEGESRVRSPLRSLDTEATLDACRVLGAGVSALPEEWRVEGTEGKLKPRSHLIDAKNSGTTLRIMTAVASHSPSPVRLTGDESLRRRPMGPLVEALRELGVEARCEGEGGRPPVVVGGGMVGGEVEITGEVSSQFISALLIACPYAREEVRLSVVGELRSRPYVEVTLSLLGRVGARVKRNARLTEFRIPGEQLFRPLSLTIPGDYSSASFVLAAGALVGSEVRVSNLDPSDPQGDRIIAELLEEFGAEVEFGDRTLTVLGAERLEGVEVDCGDCPDLVPVLAVLGAVAEGRTVLTNIPHLRLKETDRLHALSSELGKMGAEVRELPDELRIRGVRKLRGARVNSFGDHRMAMALAVAGLVAEGTTVVEGAESIPVSYPTFVEDMKRLGARMEYV
ncbi:MAG: 3-phosphoshikimate 1-carboxyvinyltransferase [Candidatus Hadarchaeales archaeon]